MIPASSGEEEVDHAISEQLSGQGNIPSRPDPNNPNFRVGRIYSFDTPGWTPFPFGGVTRDQLYAFYVIRWTFKEWVRVKLNNIGFAEAEMVEGSRASGKQDWSLVYYSTLSEYEMGNKRLVKLRDYSVVSYRRCTAGNDSHSAMGQT